MDNDSLMAAFAVDENEPWFRAVLQEIDAMIEDTTLQVEREPGGGETQFTEAQRTHASGGLFRLRDLRAHLIELNAEANKTASL